MNLQQPVKDCRNDGIGKFLVFDFLYRTQVQQSEKTQINLNKFTNHKSRHSREGGNPLQINSLVQAIDARLPGHDNIEVF